MFFQLDDMNKSRVDARLMCNTTYGSGTDRLLLPGYRAKPEGGNIFRIRHGGDIFVFYQTYYGLFGEVYRVEQFDLKGSLIRKGEFRCGEDDVPVTLVRVTAKDSSDFPIYGVGLFNRHRELTEQEKQNGGSFGHDIDPDGDGYVLVPMDWGDLGRGAYLTIDYPKPMAYLEKHGLHNHVRLKVKFFEFEGEQPPLDESVVRQRDDIYVESLEEGLNLPFLRSNRYDDYEEPPPYTPERP